MRTCVILNDSAGSAGRLTGRDVEAVLAPLGDISIERPAGGDAATEVARRALDDGCDLLVAAGGDGTVNQVVTALAESASPTRLGVLPLGTANDFARSIGMPNRLEDAVAALRAGRSVPADLLRVGLGTGTRYCINVSAGGFSGRVDENLTDEMKRTWGPLAYVRSALDALPDLEDYETRVRFDDGGTETVEAFNIVVANGRYVAGGVPIAPRARLDDGLADVVIVKAAALPELGALAPRILLGRHLDSPAVAFRRCRRVRIESEPGMWFNVDGELIGNESIAFELISAAVRVVTGSAAPGVSGEE